MSQAESVAASAISWGLVLIAAILVLGAIVWLVRRRLLSAPRTDEDDGWTLQHLREMLADGRITAAEFEALKLKMLAATQALVGQADRATSAGDRRLHQDGDESIKGAPDQGR